MYSIQISIQMLFVKTMCVNNDTVLNMSYQEIHATAINVWDTGEEKL